MKKQRTIKIDKPPQEIPDDVLQRLVDIAKEERLMTCGRVDFAETCNDDVDFCEVAIWNVEQSLIKAYQLGFIHGSAKFNKK